MPPPANHPRPSFARAALVMTVALLLCIGLLTAHAPTACGDSAEPSAADGEFFETRVRPLLVAHCAECHSGKTGDPEGGLSFDSRADFRAAEGVAVPGRPDDSLLVKVVRYDGDLQMPPDGRLPREAIETLEEWVRRGLPWPDDGRTASGGDGFDLAKRAREHWCWLAPRASAPPAVQDAGWCRGDIDRFVLARLEAASLRPAAEASIAVLVRRASELLTGLPADPEDVERVGGSTDSRAFEGYIDRLLDSPHFGERFARHWLDVVRFGETRGHEFDFLIPNAWRYRDWVVNAFNADLPYDQFVREQIAGDLIPQPRLDPRNGANLSVVGTGFWFLGEAVHAPVDIAQDEADRVDNCIDTFGKAFLGLALGCARCHDHKFDAISNEDYYALSGVVMSSSYRQVPFETLQTNRRVARRLEEADRIARGEVLLLLRHALGADAIGFVDAVDAAVKDTRPAGEIVIADYTLAHGSTPIMADGAAWQVVSAGTPVLQPLVEGLPRELRLEPVGHAHSDPLWSTTRSVGDRDPVPLGSIDRAGRMLRTPKARVTGGVLWHRVRGAMQINAVVDGHSLLSGGPLYGTHVMNVDTQGQWRWIRQDLRRDMAWEMGHVVHVEYAASAGAADVAEVVATADQPQRTDPPAVEAVNRRLDRPTFDWMAAAARQAVERAETLATRRDAILADFQLVSATAPAMLDGNGIDQCVLLKGAASRRGELSPRRFLEAIDGGGQPGWPQDSSGRLQLAQRVLDPGNPLTSRVMVNRVWHHLFGRGLVPTTDNFGRLGEPAADPLAQALLDTLAVRFRDEGWSVKRLVREIVTSSSWRMSGARDARAVAQDPLNLLWHHYPLRRLEGEAIRDKILAVSGRLDRTLGGPGVEVFITDFHDGRGRPASGPRDGAGRRSIYTRVRRNFLPSFLVTFDMPVPFQAMGKRNVTNVPAQSLALMNDPFVADQAALWARKSLSSAAQTPEQRIERMYLEAFARRPTNDERVAALEYLAARTRLDESRLASSGNEASWADLAHALMNTKEFIFVP